MSNHNQTPKPEPWLDSSAEPFISFQNVVKSFGGFVAVDNVSLDIYKSELFCLLGGSGCGKTTLLRMLAGFEAPTSGKIFIDGQDMADLQPHSRPTNMMFQSYALFPHMTVEKNIAFGLKQEGMEKAKIEASVADVMSMVKMEEFAKRKPYQLSGGQRQRVALARALVKRPKVLLLDEPLGALDKNLRESTQFEIMRIQEELGITFVVVTHDQEEAMTLSSRIGVMDQGKIQQVGTPNEIYEHPRSIFVANFIGSVNIFEGYIVQDEANTIRIKSEDTDALLYINHAVRATLGDRVSVAIRPEKLCILREKPACDENYAQGMIIEYAYMGSGTVYKIKLKSGKMVDAALPNLDRNTEQFTCGEEVYLDWKPYSAVVIGS